MNNNEQIPEYTKHPFISNLFITKTNNKIVKEFKADSDPNLDSLLELIDQQKLQGKYHQDFILGIQEKYLQKNQKKIIVFYNCDDSAKPLSQVNPNTPKEQFLIFKNLFQIYGFLNQNKIQHRNLKPNNIIFYKNKLLLTDWSYKDNIWLIDKINVLDNKNKSQQNNTYPYLSPEMAEIMQRETYGYKLDGLKNRTKLSVQQQDQFAIATMMLEVFFPLKDRGMASILIRQLQIQQIDLQNKFSKEDEQFIKQTIYELLTYKQFDFNQTMKKIEEIEKQIIQQEIIVEEQKRQDEILQQKIQYEMMVEQFQNYKIDKTLINKDNYNQVKALLENKVIEFDFKLLYYFTKAELHTLNSNIMDNQIIDQTKKYQLQLQVKNILKQYDGIDKQNFDYSENNMNKLSKEYKYVLLVYLDEKIEKLLKSQHQQNQHIVSQEMKFYYNIQSSLKEYYEQLNNTPKELFEFNQIQQQIIPENKKKNEQSSNFSGIYNQQENQIDNQIIQPEIESEIPANTDRLKIENKTIEELKKHIREKVKEKALQLYFCQKCLLEKKLKGYIYIHQAQPLVIFIGEHKNQSFKGQVIQLQKDKQQTIKHFINVQTDQDFQNIRNEISQNSQILYLITESSVQMFRIAKEYNGEIKNGQQHGKGIEIDKHKEIYYQGQWDQDKMKGQGIKKLINTDYIEQNTPYKWEGSFDDKKLNGEDIKTYLFSQQNRKIYLEGRYDQDHKIGTHICYMQYRINNEEVTETLYQIKYFSICNRQYSIKRYLN